MNNLRLLVLSLICLFAATASGCRHTVANRPRGDAYPSLGRISTGQALRVDDLKWLVGKWKCISQDLRPGVSTPHKVSQPRDPLVFFNVYYPFADDDLKLELTANPADRPIAAELLSKWNGPPRKEEFTPFWTPFSTIRIGTDRIRQGNRFESLEFTYRLLPEHSPPRLVMQSSVWTYTLEKVCADAGDIEQSFVVAPLKHYSKERRETLQREYDRLSLALLLDSAKAADPDDRYPKQFIQAALAFRNATDTNRYREAIALQKRLPVTPVKSTTNSVGTSNKFTGRGSRFIVRDYDKPSFVLERNEVLRLLGTPAFSNSLTFTYVVAKSPEHTFDLYISLDFHNDYVIASGIVSSAGPWKSDEGSPPSGAQKVGVKP